MPAFCSKDATGEVKKQFWFVDNMLTFLNIGFTHNIKASATAPPSDAKPVPVPKDASAPAHPAQVLSNHIRYLVCAGCEQGPVGACLSQREFYVDPDNVEYS